MAETKKYFWLKLKEDFFEDKIIRYLRKLPDGNAIVIVFLKMQLKSLKTEGFIKYDGLLPTCEEELALILDEDANLVRFTIGALEKVGAVERWDNDTLYISALQPLIGSESAVAERVRKHRAKKKALEGGQALPEPEETPGLPAPEKDALQCNTSETKCNTEIETDIETEKEKEIEIEKEQTDKHREEPPAELNPRQQERVELLRELFVGWKINDYQIFHLSSLINSKIPYDPIMSIHGLEIKIYDYLQDLTLRAKSYDVKHIYGWMLKVIPEMDFDY